MVNHHNKISNYIIKYNNYNLLNANPLNIERGIIDKYNYKLNFIKKSNTKI